MANVFAVTSAGMRRHTHSHLRISSDCACAHHISNMATALGQATATGFMISSIAPSATVSKPQGSVHGGLNAAQIRPLMARAHTAVQAGEFGLALVTYELLLRKPLDLPTRIAVLSGRAHTNHKFGVHTKDRHYLHRSLKDCIGISRVSGSGGHFPSSLLHARVLADLEHFTEAIQQCNIVTSQATNDLQKRESMKLMNDILKRTDSSYRGGEALERAARRKAQREVEVWRVLHELAQLTPAQIIGVTVMSTATEVRRAFDQLSLVYHPDKPGGDFRIFQKIDEAYRRLMGSH
ncbi:hypothetical protein DL93DRAFT_2224239 [Clavulina sp. PMI_390]|nr:hypothetical protein DL93DRAFT_2224239 [Clavulina sp. PMI_390]